MVVKTWKKSATGLYSRMQWKYNDDNEEHTQILMSTNQLILQRLLESKKPKVVERH